MRTLPYIYQRSVLNRMFMSLAIGWLFLSGSAFAETPEPPTSSVGTAEEQRAAGDPSEIQSRGGVRDPIGPYSATEAEQSSTNAPSDASEIQERAVPMQKGPGPEPPVSRFQLLPASPEPPEILAKRHEAENALRNINQGRLSSAQLRQMLLSDPNPNVRAKAQAATQSVPAVPVPFGVTLTPSQRRLLSPFHAEMTLFGAEALGGDAIAIFRLYHYNSPGWLGHMVVKPTVRVLANLPSSGWYLIDFYGSGNAKATLYHQISRTVLTSWDKTTSPPHYKHFATVEYLAQDWHQFDFVIDTGGIYFSEVSITSY